MKRIRIAIVGYGNLGKGVRRAIERNPDMKLTQIITRDPDRVRKQVKGVTVCAIGDFTRNADVAVLCSGSKDDIFGPARGRPRRKNRLAGPDDLGQGPFFAQFFNTVDSFDTHARIPAYQAAMDRYAAANRRTAIVCAGWDPGTFSLERVLADAFIPCARHYTFWGPGVSQGHSDAVRSIKGVLDARQYTLPVKSVVEEVRRCKNPSLKTRDKHTRLVYLVAHKKADRGKIEREIKLMPHYFSEYRTRVVFISEAEMTRDHSRYPHGGFVIATDRRGASDRSVIEYRCEWASNSDATGRILAACSRACFRMNRSGRHGAYTMLDVPPALLSPHSRNMLLKEYM